MRTCNHFVQGGPNRCLGPPLSLRLLSSGSQEWLFHKKLWLPPLTFISERAVGEGCVDLHEILNNNLYLRYLVSNLHLKRVSFWPDPDIFTITLYIKFSFISCYFNFMYSYIQQEWFVWGKRWVFLMSEVKYCYKLRSL